MIKNYFTVNGIPFAQWFNTNVKPFYKQYENFVSEQNFITLMQNLELFSGKKEISLEEFCGHFAIIYNETGGTFLPLREFGGPEYCFNKIMPNGMQKYSYNQLPNKLAGNQLKEWNVIASQNDVNLWNGQIYPRNASSAVKQAAMRCDFYRFRGYGFNQLTWRNAFEEHLEPFLPKKIDLYSVKEFEDLLYNNIPLACKAFHSYTYKSVQGKAAMIQLQSGNFTPYGNLVSGNWTWYVQNKFLPRAAQLLQLLKNVTIANFESYAIEGMSLSPSQIKMLQTKISTISKVLINIDGAWGPKTEAAFRKCNLTIKQLLS